MGKGIFGALATDANLEREGRWFDFPGMANDDGTIPRVKLSRMSENNPAYQSAMEAVSKDLRRDIELDILTEDRAGPVFRKVFIDTILLEWEHVQNAAGQEIPISEAEALFKVVPEFFKLLRVEASRLSNFREAAVAELSKK